MVLSRIPVIPLLLLLLTAVHLLAGLCLTVVHYTIPDEMLYLLMNKALEQGRLAIENGYDAFASPMLIAPLSTAHDGQLYPQYPSLYAFVTVPFYWLAGKTGLALVNMLAFPAILFFTYHIQKMLFLQRLSAWLAVLITACGGYLWLYSQAIAPHMLQLALIMAGCWMFVRGFFAGRIVYSRYLWSSVLFGIALGVRYDTLFALPAIILPLLFARPVRWRALMMLLPGILAGLVALSVTNHIKFGTWHPFTYGASAAEGGLITFSSLYLLLGAAGVIAVLAVWGITRLYQAGKGPSRLWLALMIAAAITLLVVITGGWLFGVLYGLLLTVVNYSALPLEVPIPAGASRTALGGFQYFGEYKLALLQSCPFIAVLTIPLLHKRLISSDEWPRYVWLSLVPLAFIGFYGSLAWDGGFAFTMRYFVPVLPFLSMIVARILARLLYVWKLDGKKIQWLRPLALGGVIALAAVIWADQAALAMREWMLLYLPLTMWLAVPVMGAVAFYDKAAQPVRQCALAVVAFAIFWGGSVALWIQYPRDNLYKTALLNISRHFEREVEADALFIGKPLHVTSFFEQEDRQFRLASFYQNWEISEDEVRGLIDHFTQKDVAVYVTDDLAAFPVLRDDLSQWGYHLQTVREANKSLGSPALMRIISERDL